MRSIYEHQDQALTLEFVDRLGHDLQDTDLPIEARQLGRTLMRRRDRICAWHASGVSNGPTERSTTTPLNRESHIRSMTRRLVCLAQETSTIVAHRNGS